MTVTYFNKDGSSYTVEDLKSSLRTDWCEVKFTKADGSERVMISTLNFDLIPEESRMPLLELETERVPENPDLVKVYEKDVGWRSFKPSRLLNFVQLED